MPQFRRTDCRYTSCTINIQASILHILVICASSIRKQLSLVHMILNVINRHLRSFIPIHLLLFFSTASFFSFVCAPFAMGLSIWALSVAQALHYLCHVPDSCCSRLQRECTMMDSRVVRETNTIRCIRKQCTTKRRPNRKKNNKK